MQLNGDSFSSFAHLYDSFIIDQWGVLHDGKVPYAGVTDCLQALKAAKKQLILLSNSSKRKASSASGLAKVGIDPAAFDQIVTSGELAWQMIYGRTFDFDLVGESSNDGVAAPLPPLRVFVIGNNDDDADYVRSCNCVLAPPETAQFVLARGTFCLAAGPTPGDTVAFSAAEDLVAAVGPWLDRCAARRLPMLVSNPDFHRPGSGAPMPGLVAKQYAEDKRGSVYYLGKPYVEVYNACFDAIRRHRGGALDKGRVVGVGDSLDHDILGAHRAGIASAWTANGVHCGEMGVAEAAPALADDAVLQGMYERYAVRPTHTVPAFRW